VGCEALKAGQIGKEKIIQAPDDEDEGR